MSALFGRSTGASVHANKQARRQASERRLAAHGRPCSLDSQIPENSQPDDFSRAGPPKKLDSAVLETPSGMVTITIPDERQDLSEKRRKSSEKEKTKGSCLKKFKFYYDKHGFNRLTPIILLVLYTFLGAGIFYAIECDNEVKQKGTYVANLEIVRSKAIDELQYLIEHPPPSYNTKRNASYEFLAWYESTLPKNFIPVTHDTPESLSWDIWGSIFYVGTIYTTIGYGNIYPQTIGGQIFTMIYAIFGIPLVLSILNDLGKFFCRWANLCWFKMRQYYRRIRRRRLKSESKSESETQTKRNSSINSVLSSMTSSMLGKVTADEFDNESMPISMALCMCFGWMVFCSGVFLIWERKWSYFTSFYFFFISLSTIGLGDIVPNEPKMMILSFPFVIIGLSLVSMTINVIQQKIEAYLFKMMQKIQEEYKRAMEMGEGPEKDEIMARIMKDQPWFMKNIMPSLLGEKQLKELDQHIEETAQATTRLSFNSKSSQTDEGMLDKTDAVAPCYTKEAATSPQQAQWLMDKSVEFSPEMINKSISPRPQSWLIDKSMEFSPETMDNYASPRTPDPEWIMDKSTEFTPTMVDHAVSPRSPDSSWVMDKSTEFSPVMMDNYVSPRSPDPSWVMNKSTEFCPNMEDHSVSPISSDPSWSMEKSMEFSPEMHDADTQIKLTNPECKVTQTNQVTLDETGLQTSMSLLNDTKPDTADSTMQTSLVKMREKNSQIGAGVSPHDQSIQANVKTEEDCTQTNVECLVITLPGPTLDPLANGNLYRSEPLTESSASDVEIQTDDSYLKIAKRLNALRTNRTKSLAVLALPKDREKQRKLVEAAAAARAPITRDNDKSLTQGNCKEPKELIKSREKAAVMKQNTSVIAPPKEPSKIDRRNMPDSSWRRNSASSGGASSSSSSGMTQKVHNKSTSQIYKFMHKPSK